MFTIIINCQKCQIIVKPYFTGMWVLTVKKMRKCLSDFEKNARLDLLVGQWKMPVDNGANSGGGTARV